jgi:hypothetical protein
MRFHNTICGYKTMLQNDMYRTMEFYDSYYCVNNYHKVLTHIQDFHKRSKHFQKICMYKESECRQMTHETIKHLHLPIFIEPYMHT